MKQKNLTTMYERLEWILQQRELTPNAASTQLGYKSRNMLREVLDRKKQREFSSTLLVRLYKHYRVSPNWILLGIGEPYI